MTIHKARMIKEHSELIIRIDKLHNFIYGNGGINIHTDIENNKTQDNLLHNMSEYANKCMQLMNMKNYLHALECRLVNEGIHYENGEYRETVMRIESNPNTEDNSKDNSNKDE